MIPLKKFVLLIAALCGLTAPLTASKFTISTNPSDVRIEILNVVNTSMKGRSFDNMTPAVIDLRRNREPYRLRFSKAGYESKIISLTHNQQPRTLQIELLPLVAEERVSFSSTPAGASVLVAGQDIGVTPVSAVLRFTRPNSRTPWQPLEVRYTLRDYEDISGRIDSSHWNADVAITMAQLVKNRAINFESTPAGAEVVVNGSVVGNTPHQETIRFSRNSSSAAWTRPQVSVQLTDYATESRTLTHDGSSQFAFDLGRIFHRKERLLTINDDLGDPIPTAPVTINGELVGNTNAQGQYNAVLNFKRDNPGVAWNSFTLSSAVTDNYLPNQISTAYPEDGALELILDPVIELATQTYFPITQMTSRGPRRTISDERRVGIFDDRDLNSPATEIRPVTNFERDQRNLNAVNSFTVTPDGQNLIYAVTMESDPGNYYSNIFQKSAILASSPVTQLTRGSRFWDTEPRAGIEEGSSLIVFQSNRGVAASWDISSFRLQEGRVVGGIVQLTRDTRFNYGPSFASEQQPIYFSSMDEYPQAEPRISSVRIDGASFTNLGETGADLNLTTQDQIYFTRVDPDTEKQQIYRITSDGFSFALVVNDAEFSRNNCFDPAVSPDGTKLLFTSDYHQDEQGRRNNNIYLYDLASGLTPLQLTDNGSDDIQPVWSPTEPDVVYFLSNRRGIYNVWRMTIRVAQ